MSNGSAFSLVSVQRVTVDRATLEQIVNLLKIPTKADRDRIFSSGIVILAPSASGGSAQASSRGRSRRSSAASGTSSTPSRTRRRPT